MEEFKTKNISLPEKLIDQLQNLPYNRENYHIVTFEYASGTLFRGIKVLDRRVAQVYEHSPIDISKVVSLHLTI